MRILAVLTAVVLVVVFGDLLIPISWIGQTVEAFYKWAQNNVKDFHSAPYSLVQTFVLLFGGAWALQGFSNARRVRSGEVLLKLEENVNAGVESVLATLVELESSRHYRDKYLAPLLKSLIEESPGKTEAEREENALSDEELEIIVAVERALRHLHMAWHVRGAGNSPQSIDRAYRYFIKVIVNDNRPALRDYVKRYWYNLYIWGKGAESGLFGRLALQARLARRELRHVWRGGGLELVPTSLELSPNKIEIQRLQQLRDSQPVPPSTSPGFWPRRERSIFGTLAALVILGYFEHSRPAGFGVAAGATIAVTLTYIFCTLTDNKKPAND